MPVEAINQAGAYFLHGIEGWQEHLVLVNEGKTARIHRPDPTLFLLLKIRRMTESDLDDCTAFMRWASRSGERTDGAIVADASDRARSSSESAGKVARLDRLRDALRAFL